jgi:hypothetical protein
MARSTSVQDYGDYVRYWWDKGILWYSVKGMRGSPAHPLSANEAMCVLGMLTFELPNIITQKKEDENEVQN